ncbi:MAG: hypothetical protein ACQESD_06295 [Thermoplasmatota archaeon]
MNLEELKEKRYLNSLSPYDLMREIRVLWELEEKYEDEEKLEWVREELEKRLEIEREMFVYDPEYE